MENGEIPAHIMSNILQHGWLIENKKAQSSKFHARYI